MSIDSNSQCVRSNYFAGKSDMDESLSDFQVTKQNCKGPKTIQKLVKPKTRKAKKQIKGQKDIRSVLKSKNNELISYSKEFDNVCKKSGLNVDSEELQLAIALSKSLHTGAPDDASASQSLSTQGRIAKIRTTLQEYGFKVPETKITTANKKTKKLKKHYKLLNTTAEEKHEKVLNKYSQVLFECSDCSRVNINFNYKVDAPIFNIATNLQYEHMKDNNIFYVNNLVEKSTTNGCLLRDWSEIPGRPVTPVLFDRTMMDFSEILCSQDELDVILSGAIKTAQGIIAAKEVRAKKCIESESLNVKEIQDDDKKELGDDITEINSKVGDEPFIIDDEINANIEFKTEVESNIDLTSGENYRSCSPDIFDDEVSCIMEVSKPITQSQGQKTKLFTEETNYMDLTDCVPSQNTVKSSQNLTKRNSNDFMEMTKCAVSGFQAIHGIEKEVDLTQSPDDNSVIIVAKHNKNGIINYIAESPECSFDGNDETKGQKDFEDHFSHEEIDLTQNDINLSNDNKIQELVEYVDTDLGVEIVDNDNTKDTKLISDDIDLTQSSNEGTNKSSTREGNLTQSSKSSIDSNDLPDVIIEGHKSQDLDDTIILKPEEYLGGNDIGKQSVLKDDHQVFDLTQANKSKQSNNKSNDHSQSFYEDFVHDHSNSKENLDNIDLSDDNNSVHNTSKESDNIDLTQSSDGSENVESEAVSKAVTSNSSLGKRDEISIDYDEIIECVSDNEIHTEKAGDSFNVKNDSSKSLTVESDVIVNSSQNSQVFELADRELDYSLHRSRHENKCNFDFGGISIMDDISGVRSSKEFDLTKEGSFLPDVNVKSAKEKFITTTNVENACSSSTGPMVTPKNNEYIIKTDDVTPMLDYASMTTPQRNRELDKYGLKPFKRKRAIQILTHLYNQTHPMVEPYSDEDQPSPSKRPRNQLKSPNKIELSPLRNTTLNKQSPTPVRRKHDSRSPKKVRELNLNSKESTSSKSSYEVSSETLIIKAVDCHPDDWVFQKREKAKVHSCRVPLHIAFHNYVLSRRELREAILKYEPVNIDDIHKDLVSYGHRYDPKDLLRYLDKKCITVKTEDNNARNKR